MVEGDTRRLEPERRSLPSRIALALAFGLVALLVLATANRLTAIPDGARTAIKTALPALLLGASVLAARRPGIRRYWEICFALFLASLGLLVAHLVSGPVLQWAGISVDSMRGLALTKLSESVAISLPIVVLARIVMGDLGWLQLRRGRLGLGLLVGGAFFLAFAAAFLLQARDRGLGAATLVGWLPWVLVFVLSNGFMEELQFRGLLLGRLQPFLGRHGSNVTIAVVFTAWHAPVRYAPDLLPFLAIVFILALAWGDLVHRTRSLWGSVLFHAGADIVLVIQILETYG